jgi:predicted molibdopterin-dependent oxidoreductase YjgC
MSLIEIVTRSETKSQGNLLTVEISIDGQPITTREGELLVEALMGPIQTCDTCLIEVDGKLVRSCGHCDCAVGPSLAHRLQVHIREETAS